MHLSRSASRIRDPQLYEIGPYMLFWTFLSSSLIGYLAEMLVFYLKVGHTASRQGMIYGPLNQVYGFGGVFMLLAVSKFAGKKTRFIFFICALMGGIFEALSSWLQESFFGSLSWEYSAQRSSVLWGRSSLVVMFYWGILGILYIKFIYPLIVCVFKRLKGKPMILLTWLVAFLILFDLLISAFAVHRWSDRVRNIPSHKAFDLFLDVHYPDERLQIIYPNLIFESQIKPR